MIREVFILTLIIQSLLGTAQKKGAEVWSKQVSIRTVIHHGFETEVSAPADFVKRELWRQTKTIAIVQPNGDHLRIKLSVDGSELTIYGRSLDVEDGKTHLSIVSETQQVDDYLKGLLLLLKQRILVAHYQAQITHLEGQVAVVSSQLAGNDSRTHSAAASKWSAFDSLQESIDRLRKLQQELLRSK